MRKKWRQFRNKGWNFPFPQFFGCWKRWRPTPFPKILGSAQKCYILAKIWPNMAITPKRCIQSIPHLGSWKSTWFYVLKTNFIEIYAAKKFLWHFENFQNFQNFAFSQNSLYLLNGFDDLNTTKGVLRGMFDTKFGHWLKFFGQTVKEI